MSEDSHSNILCIYKKTLVQTMLGIPSFFLNKYHLLLAGNMPSVGDPPANLTCVLLINWVRSMMSSSLTEFIPWSDRTNRFILFVSLNLSSWSSKYFVILSHCLICSSTPFSPNLDIGGRWFSQQSQDNLRYDIIKSKYPFTLFHLNIITDYLKHASL